MAEALMALGVAALLAAVSLLHRLAPWPWLLRGGAWLVIIGTVASVLAGLGYHLALYRALQPRALLPRAWWLNPTRLHGRLAESERLRVMPWFALGVAALTVTLLGCLGVLLAVWRGLS